MTQIKGIYADLTNLHRFFFLRVPLSLRVSVVSLCVYRTQITRI
jgi:hypothetical protein